MQDLQKKAKNAINSWPKKIKAIHYKLEYLFMEKHNATHKEASLAAYIYIMMGWADIPEIDSEDEKYIALPTIIKWKEPQNDEENNKVEPGRLEQNASSKRKMDQNRLIY